MVFFGSRPQRAVDGQFFQPLRGVDDEEDGAGVSLDPFSSSGRRLGDGPRGAAAAVVSAVDGDYSYVEDDEALAVHSGRAQFLCVSIWLFASITAAQFAASRYAHSDALLVDCASMLVDTLTYVGNWCAESPSCQRRHSGVLSGRRGELGASAFSLLVLYSVTLSGLVEAGTSLNEGSARLRKDDERMDPRIVLVFGVLGLALDAMALLAFFTQALHKGGASANVLSALTHVAADSLRSVATTAEALLVIYFGEPPEKTDAWTTVLVSGTILFGSCGALRLWLHEAVDECAARANDQGDYQIIAFAAESSAAATRASSPRAAGSDVAGSVAAPESPRRAEADEAPVVDEPSSKDAVEGPRHPPPGQLELTDV